MDTELFIEVQSFIENHIGRKPINPETRLYEDLGIYGDDAVEFLIAFGKKFNVDVSKFMAADYFKGEGFDLFSIFKKERVYKSITVSQLGKAVIEGRLTDEVINS